MSKGKPLSPPFGQSPPGDRPLQRELSGRVRVLLGGRTQKWLAKEAGIGQQYVSFLLNGRQSGTIAAWERLLEVVSREDVVTTPGPIELAAEVLAAHVIQPRPQHQPEDTWFAPCSCGWRCLRGYTTVGVLRQARLHIAQELANAGLVSDLEQKMAS